VPKARMTAVAIVVPAADCRTGNEAFVIDDCQIGLHLIDYRD
jgi:hypothetical protein